MHQQLRMQKLSLSGLKCQSVLVTRLSWNPSPGQSQHSNELIAAGHLKCLISVRTTDDVNKSLSLIESRQAIHFM